MKNLVMLNRFGVRATFALEELKAIMFDYAMNLMSDEELAENCTKKAAVMIVLHFANGETSTYQATNWTLMYE